MGDPSTRQIRVALEALRARRAELREANAEIDGLREQLLKAQADADAEREAKDFVTSERDLLEKSKKAYAADNDVLKNQLDAARTTIEEERAAKAALRTDINRLQTQLSSLGDGLKKIQASFASSNAQLEESKKAKAALISEVNELKSHIEEADRKHAAATELEARLGSTKAELQEQQTMVASMQLELAEKKKAAESSAAVAEALQAQLCEAREELGCIQEARLLQLGEVRAELETKMQAAWHEICQDLDQAPHRMLCTRPSAIRPRKQHQNVAAASSGSRISFSADESMVTRVAVTSFRDLGSNLWFDNPDANVECERCENRGPKALGFMRKVPGLSELARQEFLCAECNRLEAVENKRREELKALDSKRNDEMKSFFPSSSPPHQAGNIADAQRVETSSDSYESESESSLPHSESPGTENRGWSSTNLRRTRSSADVSDVGSRAKQRKV